MKKIGICVFVIILAVLVSVFSILVTLKTGINKSSIHTPTESERKRGEEIENILLKKDAKTVSEIDKLLYELAKEENNVTSLLEQKASTQIGCISIVVTIILAVFSFYIKDLHKYLMEKKSICFSFLFIVGVAFLMVIFFCSIYFSYQSFKVRGSFASYNIDNLFDIMKNKGDDLTTFQIYNILENYQVYAINEAVNEEKADALSLAMRFFVFGMTWFFATLLITICIINIHSILRREVT